MATDPARWTRQRSSIQEALEEARAFLSAQELHALLGRRGVRIGLTTVYRNLQALVERGEVDCVRTADGEIVYRKCRTVQHHHHLVCSNCGLSVELKNEELERWARRIARRHGFSEVSHELELFGLCRACSPRR